MVPVVQLDNLERHFIKHLERRGWQGNVCRLAMMHQLGACCLLLKALQAASQNGSPPVCYLLGSAFATLCQHRITPNQWFASSVPSIT